MMMMMMMMMSVCLRRSWGRTNTAERVGSVRDEPVSLEDLGPSPRARPSAGRPAEPERQSRPRSAAAEAERRVATSCVHSSCLQQNISNHY